MLQPTSTSAEPAASRATRSASSRIICASASSAAAAAAASTASPLAIASAGHSASASSPLPGISIPTTSIHSGAARASSANAAVEPPAYARQ